MADIDHICKQLHVKVIRHFTGKPAANKAGDPDLSMLSSLNKCELSNFIITLGLWVTNMIFLKNYWRTYIVKS